MNSAGVFDEQDATVSLIQQLSVVYEEQLADKMGDKLSPFFARFPKTYDGRTGVLFVGKGENMSGWGGYHLNLNEARDQIHNDYIATITSEKWKRSRSAYIRTLHSLANEFVKRGITCFARTNLYKLSNTRRWQFEGEYDIANVCVFLKEIEGLQPKYVILLTSGKEVPFLNKLGKQQSVVASVDFAYSHKRRIQKRQLNCITIENMNNLLVTAFHPQGKPDLVKPIMNLIDKVESCKRGVGVNHENSH